MFIEVPLDQVDVTCIRPSARCVSPGRTTCTNSCGGQSPRPSTRSIGLAGKLRFPGNINPLAMRRGGLTSEVGRRKVEVGRGKAEVGRGKGEVGRWEGGSGKRNGVGSSLDLRCTISPQPANLRHQRPAAIRSKGSRRRPETIRFRSSFALPPADGFWEKRGFAGLRVIGQLSNTYIVCEAAAGLSALSISMPPTSAFSSSSSAAAGRWPPRRSSFPKPWTWGSGRRK